MIKELCDRHGVPCVYTSKLFLNRFTSSITINFPDDLRDNQANEEAYIRRKYRFGASGPRGQMLAELAALNRVAKQNRQSFIDGLFTKHGESFPEDTEYRMNKVSVTFYHDDPTALASLIGTIPITKITVPRNEQEIAFLRTNTDKVIQDRYYLDQYRYRVQFKPKANIDALNEHVDSHYRELGNDGKLVMEESRAYFFWSTQTPSILYLSDFTDMFLTKIATREMIEKVTEVVLRDE